MQNKFAALPLIIIGVFILIGSGFLLWQETQEDNGSAADETSEQTNAIEREAVLEEARTYEPNPDEVCSMVLTDALHVESGAEYTFPSSCMPDGWKPTDNNTE